MRRAGRLLGRALLALAAALGAVWLLAPRAELDGAAAAEAMADAVAAVPEAGALDGWLAAREAAVPALRPGAEKRIRWAGAAGAATPLSVVYVHGFSASAEEIRPVPDLVAQALGANLFFTRLAGHGRDGPAMAEATAEDWMADVAEALEVGRRIGGRVLVISTSTGGPLVALAAAAGQAEGVAGAVFVSPNFAVNNPAAPLLEWPGARWWMPLVAGRERSFEPRGEGQAAHWTTRYPAQAVFPMVAVVRAARALDLGALALPALVLTDPGDRVVVAAETAAAMARWGGPVRALSYAMGPGDDPYAHVIAGDIMSPGQTARAVADILDWAAGLGLPG